MNVPSNLVAEGVHDDDDDDDDDERWSFTRGSSYRVIWLEKFWCFG